MGKILIIAKNIVENASGSIRDDANHIVNITNGKFRQHSDASINYKNYEGRKPPTDIRITKVEGPFDGNGKLVDKIELGKSYAFKATLTRTPTITEVALLKWAIKLDDDKKEIIGGAAFNNKLKEHEIHNFFKINHDFEKARIYAFYQKPEDSVSIDLRLKKKMPKIIFVNGHWNRIANKLGMSPGAGGKEYWRFFTGNLDKYKNSADNYFKIKSSKKPYYIDGSSLWGGSESGSERKIRGYDYSKKHFDKIIEGIGNNKVYLISHSEGGACAAGVAKYLIERGVGVGESIMLSADEGDEFFVEGNYPAYQIVAGYLTKDLITRKNIFNIDPVVKDNIIKGISKYGVYISNGGFTTVHGDTVDEKIFDLLKRLKALKIEQAWNSKGKIVYQTNTKDQDWAKIDEYILYNKKIDLYPKSNSNIVEFYFERED